jgi:hypothetical protein
VVISEKSRACWQIQALSEAADSKLEDAKEAQAVKLARVHYVEYRKSLLRQLKEWQSFFEGYGAALGKGDRSNPDHDSTALSRTLLQAVPKQLVRKGIPTQHRALMWFVMCGAADKMERDTAYYPKLVANAERRTSAPGPAARVRAQIERDVERTMPDNPRVASAEGKAALRRLLLAYTARKASSLSYAQSMASVAGLLLVVMEEEPAFWTLVVVIEEYMNESMYHHYAVVRSPTHDPF